MAKRLVKYFVVDSFTDSPFKGNPAAVCFLEEEKDDKWLQSVAAEFNMPTTGYLICLSDKLTDVPRFRLRWFTTVAELKLCGHVTIAASQALFSNGLVNTDKIEFETVSGILTAKRVPPINKTDDPSVQNGGVNDSFLIELDFPTVPTVPTEAFNSFDVAPISMALNGASVIDIRRTTLDDLLVLLPSGEAVEELNPQFEEVLKCPGRGLLVTGPAPPQSGFDFYSRFFAPKIGINEDFVCGSAHCALVPYWSEKLGKCDFLAYQASRRSGILDIHLDEQNQRVLLRGKAVTVMGGFLLV